MPDPGELLFDAYGRPTAPDRGVSGWTDPRQVAPKLYDHTEFDFQRGWRPKLDFDISATQPRVRWRAQLSDSRYVYATLPLVAGGVHQKSDYTIGSAWFSKYTGKDKAWGKLADAALERWHRICTVKGGNLPHRKLLWIRSKSIDVDGEFFTLRTRNADGFPLLQPLEAHRIGQRGDESIVESGAYRGLPILNGIITNAQGRPVAYRVLGATEDDDRDISAAAMHHGLDPRWISQARGIPCLTYGILDWYDLKEIRETEKIGVKTVNQIALLETNSAGGVDSGRALLRSNPQPTAAAPGVQMQTLAKGMIRYLAANTGAKLEAFAANRPSPAWQGFVEHLVRGAYIGLDWSYEMVFDSQNLNMGGHRHLAGKCQRAVNARADIIESSALADDLFALSCFIERGDLPEPPEDWFERRFTRPPKISADGARDEESDRRNYLIGRTNLRDLVEDADGGTLEDHLEERAQEVVLRNDIAKKYGLPADAFGSAEFTGRVSGDVSVAAEDSAQGSTPPPEDPAAPAGKPANPEE